MSLYTNLSYLNIKSCRNVNLFNYSENKIHTPSVSQYHIINVISMLNFASWAAYFAPGPHFIELIINDNFPFNDNYHGNSASQPIKIQNVTLLVIE